MKRATFVVVLLFFISGASGLIDELVWVKLFSQLLGGTTLAISTVLAAFMAGLALGSWRWGRRADADRAPLRIYARLELGVAAGAVALPVLLRLGKPVYVALVSALPEPGASLVRILFAFALVLPPTFFMGGTLPVLARFLVRRDDRLGRGLGLLYAVNTFGAVAGAFLAGFALIPALGLLPCIAIAVAGNLVASGAALWIARGQREAGAPPAAAPSLQTPASEGPARAPVGHTPQVDIRLLAALFAVTGFTGLGCELYWTRALQRFLGNTTYAFSAMLTTYLFGLAAGGWLGGRLADRTRSPARLLGWTLMASAAAVLASVPLIWNWLPALDRAAWFTTPRLPWGTYLTRRFLAATAVMIVPTFLSGMTFPLVNRLGIASLERLGRGVGRLYAANTCGAIAGSLAAGFVVLPLLGTRWSLLATALLIGLASLVLLTSRPRRPGGGEPPRRLGLGTELAAFIALAALVVLSPILDRQAHAILSDSQAPHDLVLFDREDATGATRVYRKENGELHMSVDGRHIGGTEPGIVRKEKILAHLPVALVPKAESVLAVGLGSGITLGTLALYPEVRRLTCAEIVPSVVKGARLFGTDNHDVLDDPRLHLVVGDGIQYLLTTRERFDVISSDSKLNPEFVGNSAMLAREYYELCRDHLTDRGVMVQWTATHLPNAETRVVTRTFIEVFPYAELFWLDPFNVILIGGRAPITLDADRWAARLRDALVKADLASQLLDDVTVAASYRVAGRSGLAASLGAGPVNTWLRPVIEFETVRQFQLKGTSEHETDNLHWLRSLWSADPLPVAGAVDADRLARFRASTGKYLEGYSLGAGINRLDAGRVAFEAGLAANPDDVRLRLLLEKLDTVAAGTIAEPGPRDWQGWNEFGVRKLDRGRAEEALAAFDRAIALSPDFATARFNRLLALRKLGRSAEVASEGARFTRDFPRDARGWSYQGRTLAEQGDLAGATAAFRRAAELDPTAAAYANNLGAALSRQQHWREAGEAFARAYALDPTFPDAAINAAAGFSRAGDLEEAAKWAQTCIAKGLVPPSRILTDPNLEALRASPRWAELRRLLPPESAQR